MLTYDEINRIVGDVARRKLVESSVLRVTSEPATDWTGGHAVRITIVIPAEAVHRLSGDSVLDNLVELQNRLSEAGETRLPIVEYATEQDLAYSGDPES